MGLSDVLIVIAHPDDEIFASGTICLCAEHGLAIALVCVTDGERGDVEMGFSGPQLAEIRRRELALSAAALGIGDVSFLGQADVPDPADGSADAWDQPRVISALSEIIGESAPKLILTHGPLGGYGHLAHRLVHRCVMAAAQAASYRGSVFSFCGQVERAFFSWHFDQPSAVLVDVRGFLRRRVASLSYHQSQIGFFVQPRFPRTPRKYLSALFGLAFAWTEAGRKRVPIVTATRFFKRYPIEGLALHRAPETGSAHFFREEFAHDRRVTILN